jgi:hypothetical protein
MEQMSNEHFLRWKHDPVTLLVKDYFDEVLKRIELEMASEDIIFGKNCQTELARLYGYKTCIKDFLELSTDDINGDNINENA